HPHNTVRSFSSALKVTPWSHPYTVPDSVGRMCPPLGSGLFTTVSNTAIRRSAGMSACTSVTGLCRPSYASSTPSQPSATSPRGTMSTSSRSSTSIHSWHIPSPNGPSRSSVGGTSDQPSASETRYAAYSRWASVPSGKSHSGRSPATGLYTTVALRPSSLTVPWKVAFDAVNSRPVRSSSPDRSRSSSVPEVISDVPAEDVGHRAGAYGTVLW